MSLLDCESCCVVLQGDRIWYLRITIKKLEDWVGCDKNKVGQRGDMVVKSFAILKCQIWLKEKKYYINSEKINIWYWISKVFFYGYLIFWTKWL